LNIILDKGILNLNSIHLIPPPHKKKATASFIYAGEVKESQNVRSVSRYVTYNSDKIIAFFDKYPMYTSKYLDYKDWKKLIDLKSKNAHKDAKGLVEMLKIKKGMNANRLHGSNILSK
jgi:hypothetical protein